MQRIKRKYLFKTALVIPLLLITIFYACDKTDSVNPINTNYRYEYNPLETGFFREYEISVRDTGLNKNIDTTYYVRELVTAQNMINQVEEYTLSRFYKATLASSYDVFPDTIWKSIISTFSYVNVENNIRFVRLKFPIVLNKSWDGNAENNLSTDNGGLQVYSIDTLDAQYSVSDSINFDSTLTVYQDNKRTLIDTSIAYEIYATNVGLIEKSIKKSEYQGLTQTSLFTYSQKLIQYGNE